MIITVTDGTQLFFSFEVEESNSVEDVKALLSIEKGVPIEKLQLYLNGKPLLNDQANMKELRIQNGGMLYFAVVEPRPVSKTKGMAAMIKEFDKKIKSVQDAGFEFKRPPMQEFKAEAERIYLELKDDSYKLSEIGKNHPDIAEAIRDKDVQRLAKILFSKNEEKIKKLQAEEKQFMKLSKDPMNPEYQRMLQARIHQENINKNLEFANEYLPEAFGSVNMLYINISIKGIPIKAFVDSGAQSTIMSESLAHRCGLMRLVDQRQAGRAVGVGSCKILGRIHAAQLQIEKQIFPCSFTVIENNSVQFLLGLDMLKRFNCIIDLKNNVLVFQDGLVSTRFLGDSQIPKKEAISNEELAPKLKKLMGQGFSQEEAMSALASTNFNDQLAETLLLQKRYGK